MTLLNPLSSYSFNKNSTRTPKYAVFVAAGNLHIPWAPLCSEESELLTHAGKSNSAITQIVWLSVLCLNHKTILPSARARRARDETSLLLPNTSPTDMFHLDLGIHGGEPRNQCNNESNSSKASYGSLLSALLRRSELSSFFFHSHLGNPRLLQHRFKTEMNLRQASLYHKQY